VLLAGVVVDLEGVVAVGADAALLGVAAVLGAAVLAVLGELDVLLLAVAAVALGASSTVFGALAVPSVLLEPLPPPP
jgi:hypothetical protein